MPWQFEAAAIELAQGDITLQAVDAIVNAANSGLAGGGGVDGAIHRGGGPAIKQETDERYPDGCRTGSAVISGAGNLSARHVIHAVGPIWAGGMCGEAELLAGAFRRSLELAVEHNCSSLAFPALSAGAYGYPLAEAAHIGLSTAADFVRSHGRPQLVRFVLFDERTLATFSDVMQRLQASM